MPARRVGAPAPVWSGAGAPRVRDARAWAWHARSVGCPARQCRAV